MIKITMGIFIISKIKLNKLGFLLHFK